MGDDSQFYEEELERTEKARQDLSDHTVRERTTVAGFLRVLKIQYEDCKIEKKGPEPIDIWFENARFQVTEILDEDRRRDGELHKRENDLRRAVDTGKSEYFQKAVEEPGPFLPPVLYTPKCYFQRILSCSEKKSKGYEKTYGRDAVGNIDFLVYINLKKGGIQPETESWPDLAPLKNHGWRSVSFIDNACARVLYARRSAPDFLKKAMGKTHIWPIGIGDKMFPQRLGEECEHPSP